MNMDTPIVTVRQGQLRGSVRTNIDGGQFFSFLGIPYAKPPVGELRFKAPLPADPWNGIRDATKEGEICYSRNEITLTVMGSEDCLFLNVFTKELPEANKTPKPVMVWIHGGGFIFGSSKLTHYGPDFLMLEDIVLVTLNYRLGALGFLSLEDPTLGIPGNAGLKDQLLALKWVQENIESFGGDPNNVTIFGNSAGSVCVHNHVLSPASKGLFHRAVLQSGSTFNSWAHGRTLAVELTRCLKEDVGSEREALSVLKDTPVEVLFDAQEKFFNEAKSPISINIGPVIEYPNETAFMTKSAIDLIRSGEYNKVPVMFGYTTREGMLMDFIANVFGGKKETEAKSLEELIFSKLNLEKGSEISQRIYETVKEVYFQGENDEDNIRVLISDKVFVAGIIAAVKNHLETSEEPIYLYRMSLDAGLNYFKNLGKLNHLRGVCHADELGYLFKSAVTPEILPGSLEDVSLRRFVKLWTNFAKYANPTPKESELNIVWEPVRKDRINFLDIGEELTLRSDPEPERLALWREIYQLNPDTVNFL